LQGVPYLEGVNMDSAAIIRQIAPQAKIAVVGLRRFDMVRHVVENGIGDLVSLSRPFIREPSLVQKLMDGGESDCVHCGLCTSGAVTGKGIGCHYE
jgi:2,4-dienoyl-CoA reductase-like NADH-dependent reductase (Old Yellow Enzyme family)